jgi:tetrahydromethanopterin S-methyltransferase subunit G
MISVIETALFEANIPKDNKIKQMVHDSEIQEFIQLSKKKIMSGLDQNESVQYDNLFSNPKVAAYLEAAEQVGRRNGWLYGLPVGSIVGATAGTAIGIASAPIGMSVAALALLGAAMGGISIGYIFSKVNEILTRWKAQDNVTLTKSVPIVGF